jgi:hypothetical protein
VDRGGGRAGQLLVADRLEQGLEGVLGAGDEPAGADLLDDRGEQRVGGLEAADRRRGEGELSSRN